MLMLLKETYRKYVKSRETYTNTTKHRHNYTITILVRGNQLYCDNYMETNTHTFKKTKQKFTEFSQDLGTVCVWLAYSQKKNDSCVGHRKRQSQNSTAHYGVTEVKDGHSKRSLSLKLQ